MKEEKKSKIKKQEQTLKTPAAVYYCQGCKQSKFCFIDLEKTYCDGCLRSKDECPKYGHNFDSQRYEATKYSCCMSRGEYSQYYATM